MQAKTFHTIEDKLNKLIKENQDFISKIKKKPEVADWTIAELQYNSKQARKIQSDCDKFFTSDLYHILGMGKLTVVQTNKILKLTRALAKDRSILKAASYLSANNTFDFSTKDFNTDISKPTYKSSLFNLTLTLD